MRQSAAETIVVKEKAIRLVRRADSARWQVHYKVDKLGKWMRVATGTDDVTRAQQIAEEKWHEARILAQHDAFVVSKKFKVVAEIVLAELRARFLTHSTAVAVIRTTSASSTSTSSPTMASTTCTALAKQWWMGFMSRELTG